MDVTLDLLGKLEIILVPYFTLFPLKSKLVLCSTGTSSLPVRGLFVSQSCLLMLVAVFGGFRLHLQTIN